MSISMHTCAVGLPPGPYCPQNLEKKLTRGLPTDVNTRNNSCQAPKVKNGSTFNDESTFGGKCVLMADQLVTLEV